MLLNVAFSELKMKKGKGVLTNRGSIDNLDYSIESDRGRILSSPAFRRLQKRTQVFALELNASIRTRADG